MKRILIVGGMGPQASLVLHSYLIEQAAAMGAVSNDDFPLISHLSLPVPDFISDQTKKPLAQKMIVKYLSAVDKNNFDHLVIACNTAHLLENAIKNTTDLAPLSLIETTATSLAGQGFTKVGLLATPTTVKSGLYEKPLTKQGIETINIGETGQGKVEDIVRSTIAGSKSAKYELTLKKLIDGLHAKGAEAVILGCTELSVVAKDFDDLKIIDPLKLIAAKLLA